MHPVSPRSPRPQAGFTLAELLVASGAFVFIMTAAVSMLIQWQKLTSSSDNDMAAIEENTRAINQIADDVRLSTYLYQLATVSITDNTGKALFGASPYTYQIPIVTQNSTADLGAMDQAAQTTYFRRGGITREAKPMQVDGETLMGVTSQGTVPVIAMISDQPYGITKPRYIVYWVGTSRTRMGGHQDRVDAGDVTLYAHPLYRLEASPSTGVTATPTSWYTFRDAPTACATSALQITLQAGNVAKLANPYGLPATVDMNYRFTKIGTLVIEDHTNLNLSPRYPFALRNPHPYSNAGLISPYLVNIDLRVSRVGTSGRLHAGDKDLYELNTNAFARNVPLPQLPGS